MTTKVCNCMVPSPNVTEDGRMLCCGRLQKVRVIARCKECGLQLKPAVSRIDGELSFVGYIACEKHPKADVDYSQEVKRNADETARVNR